MLHAGELFQLHGAVLQAAVGTLEAALHRKAEGAKGDGASYPRLLWLLWL